MTYVPGYGLKRTHSRLYTSLQINHQIKHCSWCVLVLPKIIAQKGAAAAAKLQFSEFTVLRQVLYFRCMQWFTGCRRTKKQERQLGKLSVPLRDHATSTYELPTLFTALKRRGRESATRRLCWRQVSFSPVGRVLPVGTVPAPVCASDEYCIRPLREPAV